MSSGTISRSYIYVKYFTSYKKCTGWVKFTWFHLVLLLFYLQITLYCVCFHPWTGYLKWRRRIPWTLCVWSGDNIFTQGESFTRTQNKEPILKLIDLDTRGVVGHSSWKPFSCERKLTTPIHQSKQHWTQRHAHRRAWCHTYPRESVFSLWKNVGRVVVRGKERKRGKFLHSSKLSLLLSPALSNYFQTEVVGGQRRRQKIAFRSRILNRANLFTVLHVHDDSCRF